MTFARAFIAMSIPLLVAALPGLPPDNGQNCNTGPLQCCDQLQNANDPKVSNLLGLLNIDAGAIDALVGINCTPIDLLVGLGQSANCAQQPVCCTGNNFNGLVALGCTPISL